VPPAEREHPDPPESGAVAPQRVEVHADTLRKEGGKVQETPWFHNKGMIT
jgi:hypothetical protein